MTSIPKIHIFIAGARFTRVKRETKTKRTIFRVSCFTRKNPRHRAREQNRFRQIRGAFRPGETLSLEEHRRSRLGAWALGAKKRRGGKKPVFRHKICAGEAVRRSLENPKDSIQSDSEPFCPLLAGCEGGKHNASKHQEGEAIQCLTE